jgi:protein LSM14
VKEPLKFEEDFDFDKANEDFKEIEEKMSNLKVDGPSADKTIEGEKTAEVKVPDGSTNGDKDAADSEHLHYDKSKSFFDHISCEAIEREKGNVQRIDWKAERKLNSETFGVPLSYRRFGFGRGRGNYANRGYSGFRSYRGGYNRGAGGGDGRRFGGPGGPARSRN